MTKIKVIRESWFEQVKRQREIAFWGWKRNKGLNMHSLEKSQALQLTDCKCSRQVANLKSGGEEGLHFGQSIFLEEG